MKPDAYKRLWVKAADASGFARIRLHDMRHGSFSHMLAAGESVLAVAAHHGHDPAMTRSAHGHASLDNKQAAVTALESAFWW